MREAGNAGQVKIKIQKGWFFLHPASVHHVDVLEILMLF
jgi:hypothetical protein